MLDVKSNYNFKLTPCVNNKVAYVTPPSSFLGGNKESKSNAISFGDNLEVAKAYASPQIDDTKQMARKIWNEVEKFDNIVILTHKSPDGDAIGSGLALVNMLNERYPDKKVDFVAPGGFFNMFNGMPGVDLIKDSYSTNKNYLAIALDCGEDHMDGLDIYKNADKCINIDHHPAKSNLNSEDSDLNIILANAPSTTEVLYNKIFKPLNLDISEKTAECLLTGLITDTGNFKNSITNSSALESRDELLGILSKDRKYSVDIITNKFDENKVASDELKDMCNKAFDNRKTLVLKDGKKIKYVIVNRKDIESFKVTDKTSDIYENVKLLASKLKGSSDTGIVFCQGEDENEVKVSMRSKNLKVDEFAQKYGGGGHECAAGFALHGDESQVIKDCLSELSNYDFEKTASPNESSPLKKMTEHFYNDNNTSESTNYGVASKYIYISRNVLNNFNVKSSEKEILTEANSLADKLKNETNIGIVFFQAEKSEHFKVIMKSNEFNLKDFANNYNGSGDDNTVEISLPRNVGNTVLLKFLEDFKNYNFKKMDDNIGNPSDKDACSSKIKDYNFVESEDVSTATDKPRKVISLDEVRKKEAEKRG